MNCLKCGRKMEEGQVFCSDCLLEMQKYPVKPGVTVQLPRREEALPAKRTHTKPGLPPEEQLKLLRRRNRILTAALVLTLLVLAAVCFFSAERLSQTRMLPGQNYSAVTSTESVPG